MLSSTLLRRTLLSNTRAQACQQIRLFSAAGPTQREQRRNVHSTPQKEKSAAEAVLPKIDIVDKEETPTKDFAKRFQITGEVIVSKIFPAGFGWQSASIIAENSLGFSADSTAFALTTGFGDAVGVLIGHCGYYAIKKAITGNEKILMRREFDTGVLLASAAFCSGSLWQPLVDVLQEAGLSFGGVFAGTWVGCGTAFYLGLRAGRTVLPNVLKYCEEPTYENSKTDAALSVAIGGATGFFVGTDAVYLPEQNFLIDVVGITEGTPDLVGCTIAGTSTSLGFGAAQTGLNVLYPAGKCWND